MSGPSIASMILLLLACRKLKQASQHKHIFGSKAHLKRMSGPSIASMI
jgi:hypothetical protein